MPLKLFKGLFVEHIDILLESIYWLSKYSSEFSFLSSVSARWDALSETQSVCQGGMGPYPDTMDENRAIKFEHLLLYLCFHLLGFIFCASKG